MKNNYCNSIINVFFLNRFSTWVLRSVVLSWAPSSWEAARMSPTVQHDWIEHRMSLEMERKHRAVLRWVRPLDAAIANASKPYRQCSWPFSTQSPTIVNTAPSKCAPFSFAARHTSWAPSLNSRTAPNRWWCLGSRWTPVGTPRPDSRMERSLAA